MSSPRRVCYVLVPALSVLATLCVVELALAWFWPVPLSLEQRKPRFVVDPHTGFRPRPGDRGSFHLGIPVVINRNGHRDDEVSERKPPGMRRVLVLGDSFTFGNSVRQEQAYPQLLELRLHEQFGDRAEVVNAGVGSWGPFQYAQYFLHYGRSFAADLVVVGFYVGNDAFSQEDSLGNLERRVVLGRRVGRHAGVLAPLRVLLLDHSHLARLLLQPGPIVYDFSRAKCSDLGEPGLSLERRQLAVHLRRTPARERRASIALGQMLRLAQLARPAPLLVVLIPDEVQANLALRSQLVSPEQVARYDFDMPQSMLSEKLMTAGIVVLDLLPALRAEQRCSYLNDAHWSAAGHQVASQAIYEAVLPLLADRPP